MSRSASFLFVITLSASLCFVLGQLPVVVNTWAWPHATDAAWSRLKSGGSSLDAVESGCIYCEVNQCDGTVGYGGSPDEKGETTLDAMIMDGNVMDSGAVADLRNVSTAISVARAVMMYTHHTLLAGNQATEFAAEMGFAVSSLSTASSTSSWLSWRDGANCQPNYRQNTIPPANTSCGPYQPARTTHSARASRPSQSSLDNHDTISMIVIQRDGSGARQSAAGTSTNGANHKVPGRVGDGPITGSGSYIDDNVGGCGATGDGDIMMRFLPCYQAVENMRRGMSPRAAGVDALKRIVAFYPNVAASSW